MLCPLLCPYILIPFLKEEFNPSIVEGLNRLSDLASKENKYVENIVNEEYLKILLSNENNKIVLNLKEFNVLEYLNKVQYNDDDLFFLLQATSPLTETEHVTGIYEKMMADKANSALTCVREKRFYWTEDGHPINYDYMNRPRRQNFAGTLMENGAIYLAQVGNILKNNGILLCEKVSVYEMPTYTAVEIDEPDDWLILEALMFKYKTPTLPPINSI